PTRSVGCAPKRSEAVGWGSIVKLNAKIKTPTRLARLKAGLADLPLSGGGIPRGSRAELAAVFGPGLRQGFAGRERRGPLGVSRAVFRLLELLIGSEKQRHQRLAAVRLELQRPDRRVHFYSLERTHDGVGIGRARFGHGAVEHQRRTP